MKDKLQQESKLSIPNPKPRTPNPEFPMKQEKGFTLIELMVVIMIISIIAAFVFPTVFKKISRSKRIGAQAQIEIYGVALDSYRLDNGSYPTTEQRLQALRTEPTTPPLPKNWDGPYLKKEIPLDPWGNPYIYICPGENSPDGYDLISYGANEEEGGEGDDQDIVSWRGLTVEEKGD